MGRRIKFGNDAVCPARSSPTPISSRLPPSPPGPPFRRPGRAQRGPGPLLACLQCRCQVATRLGPGAHGRGDGACAATLRPKSISAPPPPSASCPRKRVSRPFRRATPIPSPGRTREALLHSSHLAAMRGGAGSREAGPCNVSVSASRLPTRGDILAPVRSLTEPGAPVYLPAKPWLKAAPFPRRRHR